MGCPAKKLCLYVVSCFVIANLFSACQNKSTERTMRTTAVTPFKMTVSTGGGFTGLTSGYSLSSDGMVEQWQHFRAGKDSVLWSEKTDVSRILFFKKQLEDTRVSKKNIQKSGNMTTTVTLAMPDTTYTWYWSASGKSELSRWVKDVQRFCETMAP